MHSAQHAGFNFLYNGDYSGDIKVAFQDGPEIRKSFKELATTALYDTLEEPYTQAAREFVAFAACHEAISRLEQTDPDDLLEIPWLKTIIEEMTSEGNND